MEQDDDNESTKSEVKLGKLQFQLDYDFTKNEVGQLPKECGTCVWQRLLGKLQFQ